METYTWEEIKRLLAFYVDKIIGQNLVHFMDVIAEKFELQEWEDGKISITVISKPDERKVVFRAVLDIAAKHLGLIAPKEFLQQEDEQK